MTTISDLYQPHHRRCDDLFAEAEAAASDGKWDAAREATARFAKLLEAHLSSEEGTLFPALEQATGMRGGPTAVMRSEHQHMRAMVKSLEGAVERKAKDDYLGTSETLLVLMQQHNMKEEHILYPMCDRELSDAALLEKIGQQLAS